MYSWVSRFVTTQRVKDKKASLPYYIRSYDHDKKHMTGQFAMPTPNARVHPSRAGTSTDGTNEMGTTVNKQETELVNYEKAHEIEVWQVARAATAAPLFFEPLKLENCRAPGHVSFTDGGYGVDNNPTFQGKREIEELHGDQSIGTIVSIGTARKEMNHGNKFFAAIPRLTRKFAYGMTDPEGNHVLLQNEHDRQAPEAKTFSYFRLNDTAGIEVELDDWQPKHSSLHKKAGADTVNTISTEFAKWFTRNDNKQERKLKQCATELVKRRRRRKDTSKWEHYATGARYTCRHRGCDTGDFWDRQLFRGHLERDHGIMEAQKLDNYVEHCRRYWRYKPASSPIQY